MTDYERFPKNSRLCPDADTIQTLMTGMTLTPEQNSFLRSQYFDNELLRKLRAIVTHDEDDPSAPSVEERLTLYALDSGEASLLEKCLLAIILVRESGVA